jgi:hypothetical protein
LEHLQTEKMSGEASSIGYNKNEAGGDGGSRRWWIRAVVGSSAVALALLLGWMAYAPSTGLGTATSDGEVQKSGQGMH